MVRRVGGRAGLISAFRMGLRRVWSNSGRAITLQDYPPCLISRYIKKMPPSHGFLNCS